MQIHPIGLQQDAGSDSEEATTVGNAKLLYAYNTDNSSQPIIILEGSTDVQKATLDLEPKKAMIIQKAGADEIHSDDPAVKFTPVAYTN